MTGANALLIGVTDYPDLDPLPCAAYDVRQLGAALETHGDTTPNFNVTTHIVGETSGPWTAADLLSSVDQILDDSDHFLFYFSGHGLINGFGLQLATPDKENSLDSGVYFDTLLHRFNQASGKEVTVILDCCYSGAGGDDALDGSALRLTHLRDGVTILASSGRTQISSCSENGPSDFTQQVLDCLDRTDIPAINVVELYNWTRRQLRGQTPVLRTFGSKFSPLRAISRQDYLDEL